MPSYIPPMREIRAWVLTSAGWARGNFVIPRSHGFIEHMDAAQGVLKMRDVQLPGYAAPLSFFGVFRDAISLIVPERETLPPAPPPNGAPHQVTCLLQQGVLSGRLMLRPGIRLSDHLQRYTGFLILEECSFHAVGGTPLSEGAMPLVYANVKHIVGVTEA